MTGTVELGYCIICCSVAMSVLRSLLLLVVMDLLIHVRGRASVHAYVRTMRRKLEDASACPKHEACEQRGEVEVLHSGETLLL